MIRYHIKSLFGIDFGNDEIKSYLESESQEGWVLLGYHEDSDGRFCRIITGKYDKND